MPHDDSDNATAAREALALVLSLGPRVVVTWCQTYQSGNLVAAAGQAFLPSSGVMLLPALVVYNWANGTAIQTGLRGVFACQV